MTIDQNRQKCLEVAFAQLDTVAAGKAFPPPKSLSTALEEVLPKKSTGVTRVPASPQLAAKFATAAVEVWLRAVHSFLISASLTDASPIWASTSGYYSSHYSVRALAHLLGHFQLFHLKKIVRLELQSGRLVCSFDGKKGRDREHRFYWNVVKQDPYFVSDPLFTDNDPGIDDSDVGHRNHANYVDHISRFPVFHALDADTLRHRVQFISQIQFTTPPIPKLSRFPDIESVQVVAYHRIVKFRQVLDEIVSGQHRFWRVHRNPSWTGGMINFQLTEQGGLGSLAH